MSVIIIGEGGGAHHNLTRIAVASVRGRLSPEQVDRYNAALAELQEIADEVEES